MTSKEFLQKIIDERNNFWINEYPNFSLEEKIHYWEESTYRRMRTQGESLADEYSGFSKKWYELALENEPDFDRIFKKAVDRFTFGFDFNWEEYRKRIEE